MFDMFYRFQTCFKGIPSAVFSFYSFKGQSTLKVLTQKNGIHLCQPRSPGPYLFLNLQKLHESAKGKEIMSRSPPLASKDEYILISFCLLVSIARKVYMYMFPIMFHILIYIAIYVFLYLFFNTSNLTLNSSIPNNGIFRTKVKKRSSVLYVLNLALKGMQH